MLENVTGIGEAHRLESVTHQFSRKRVSAAYFCQVAYRDSYVAKRRGVYSDDNL